MSARTKEHIARYKAVRDDYYALIAHSSTPMSAWLNAVEAKRVEMQREATRLADLLVDSGEYTV